MMWEEEPKRPGRPRGRSTRVTLSLPSGIYRKLQAEAERAAIPVATYIRAIVVRSTRKQ